MFSLTALALKLASYAAEQRAFIAKIFLACVRASVRMQLCKCKKKNNLGAALRNSVA